MEWSGEVVEAEYGNLPNPKDVTKYCAGRVKDSHRELVWVPEQNCWVEFYTPTPIFVLNEALSLIGLVKEKLEKLNETRN